MSMKMIFPDMSVSIAESVVSVINTSYEERISAVITTNKVVLPPKTRCRVKCKTSLNPSDPEHAVLFSPDLFESELECQTENR